MALRACSTCQAAAVLSMLQARRRLLTLLLLLLPPAACLPRSTPVHACSACAHAWQRCLRTAENRQVSDAEYRTFTDSVIDKLMDAERVTTLLLRDISASTATAAAAALGGGDELGASSMQRWQQQLVSAGELQRMPAERSECAEAWAPASSCCC